MEVKDGIISDKMNSNNKVSYAQLTKGKKIERHLEGKPVLKNYTDFKYIGKPYMKQDALEKVTGEGKIFR